MRKKKYFETVSVIYKNITKKTFPDYINGVATEPNENPVIFDFTYYRGDDYNLPLLCPTELFIDYFLHALTISLAGALGVGAVGVGVTVADIAITLKGERILPELAELLVTGQIGTLKEVLALWLEESAFVGMLSPAAIGAVLIYITWCATKAYDTIGVKYQEYKATGDILKEKVDTEGYYDDKGVWHYTYSGFHMRMVWNYAQQDVQVITTSDKRNDYSHMYTTGIMPMLQMKPKNLEYFEIVEPLWSELFEE